MEDSSKEKKQIVTTDPLTSALKSLDPCIGYNLIHNRPKIWWALTFFHSCKKRSAFGRQEHISLKLTSHTKIETNINPAFERDFYWINPQSVVIPKGKLK